MKAKQAADNEAVGTWHGFIEATGWLPEEYGYGGTCHLWSGVFVIDLADRNSKPNSCISVDNRRITLDGSAKWDDHNINIIQNECTHRCIIVDDGFWGNIGAVYDPCNVSPPLLGPIGRKQWNQVLKKCACP